MDEPMSPFGVFLSSFFLAAFAGLAALMRSNSDITVKNVISSFLNSGLLGVGVSLIWFTKFKENIYFLVGVSAILGLGGQTTLDFVLKAMKQGGFRVSLGENGNVETSETKLPKEEKKDD